MPMLDKPKWEAFCRHYIQLNSNGTRAAIAAGLGKTYAASADYACDLLKKPEIKARIRELTAEMWDGLGLTPERIGVELYRGFQQCMDGEEHLSWDSEAHSMMPDGTWRFDSKGAARFLELLGKQMGVFSADKIEISGSVEEFLRRSSDDGQGQAF